MKRPEDLKWVLNLLGLNPDEREFRIVHGYLAENDRDVLSKRTFYFLMLMFSFTERSDNVQAMPVLTASALVSTRRAEPRLTRVGTS